MDDFATNSSDLSTLVEGLEPNTDYSFQLRAYTSKGPGPWNNRLPFRTFGSCTYHRWRSFEFYQFQHFFHEIHEFLRILKCYRIILKIKFAVTLQHEIGKLSRLANILTKLKPEYSSTIGLLYIVRSVV